MNKKGFTLIELLIVIGIIAILAAAVIVAINPGQQFAAARDATRESHLSTLYNSLISYQVSNQGTWGDIDLPQEPTEVCDTNEHDSNTCETEELIDLSPLVDENHINQIPVDPQGGESDYGTGYLVMEGGVILIANNHETRFIAQGISEEDFDNEVWDQWPDLDGYIYNEGQHEDMWEIGHEGDDCAPDCPEWSNSKEDSYLLLESTSWGSEIRGTSPAWTASELVDLSDFNQLKAEVESQETGGMVVYVYLQVSSDKEADNSNYKVQTTDDSFSEDKTDTVELDVSEINEGYVQIMFRTAQEMKLKSHRFWLE